jgi:hypothetical protein
MVKGGMVLEVHVLLLYGMFGIRIKNQEEKRGDKGEIQATCSALNSRRLRLTFYQVLFHFYYSTGLQQDIRIQIQTETEEIQLFNCSALKNKKPTRSESE